MNDAGAVAQLRADGTLRHLLTLEGLPRAKLEELLERAQSYVRASGDRIPASTVLAGVTVVNLFTEPSTRTRVSFELGKEIDDGDAGEKCARWDAIARCAYVTLG